jgi:hypothetical protein
MSTEFPSLVDRAFGPGGSLSASKRSAAIQQRTVEADDAMMTGASTNQPTTAEPLSLVDRAFGPGGSLSANKLSADAKLAQPRPQTIQPSIDQQQTADKKPWYQFMIDAQEGEIKAGQQAVETTGKVASDIGTAVTNVPSAFAGATAALIQGNNPQDQRRDVGKTDWKDDAIAWARRNAKESAAQEGGDEDLIEGLGLTRAKIRNLPQNLAFSILGMGAGVAAGIPASFATTPVGGLATGMAASGIAAYRMDTNGFLNDLRDKLDDGFVKARGTPMTDDEWIKYAQKYEGAVREHGLWEAIPEAIGNVVGFKLGGVIFKEAALGIKGMLKSAAAAAGEFGTELGTETITQTGQHNVEVDTGLSDGPKRSFTSLSDLAQSAKEVLPDVLLLTGTMAGGAHTAGKLKSAYEGTAFAKNRAFADALQKDVDALGFTAKGVDEDARAQLDPNRDTAIDPRLTAKPDEPGVAPGEPGVQNEETPQITEPQQRTTAVGVGEPISSEAEQQGVAQQMSPSMIDQGNPVVSEGGIKPAGEIDPTELLDQLNEVDRQAGVTTEQLSTPAVPATLQVAMKGMATELGLPEGETLQVTEVADDKRLNTFGKALNSAFGVNVHWVDFGEGGMKTSTGQNMGGFNGYRQGDTILVDPKNSDLMDTTWHELTHTLETKHPEVYADLRDTILRTVDPAMKTALYDALNKRRVAEVGKPMTASQLESELVAVTVGGQASNPEYLGQLFDSFKDKTLAQQFKNIMSEILTKLSKALQGPTYVKERQKINQTRDAITKAFVSYQQREAAKGKPTNATGATAVMPEALAVKVASSKLSNKLTNREQSNATEKRQVQEGDQQQRRGVDQSVQSSRQDRQQPSGQPQSSAKASGSNRTEQSQGKPVGQFSRIAPPLPDNDGVIRVNGREYAERTEPYTPEGTKAYLKRAVDTGPRPKSLPQEPERFFNYNYLTKLVDVADIESSKSAAENIKGNENAPKRFLAGYDGIVEPRDAIAVQELGGGKFKVIDGNGTLTALKSYGWTQIPANVFKSVKAFKDHEARQAEAPKYRSYILSNENRRQLEAMFPPSHERVILDHITANPTDAAKPTTVEVVGIADHEGIQALVVVVDGRRERDDGEPYHISLSATKSASTRNAGSMINKYGYQNVSPVVLDLPYGADYTAVNRKQHILDRLTDKQQNRPVYALEYSKYQDILKAVVKTQALLKKAPAVKKSFDAFGEKFANETGTKYKAGPLKQFPKSFAKIWYDYDGDSSRIKDVVRSTIEVQYPDQVQGAIDSVLASYPDSQLKHNLWNPDPAIAKVPKSGYRDVMFNMSFGGMRVELQMNLPEMLAAKEIGHKLYDEVVGLTQEMEKPSTSNERVEELRKMIADLDAQQAEIYGDAFKKIQERAASRSATNLRNSSSEMRSPSSSAVNRLYDQGGALRTVEKNIQQRQVNPEIVTGMSPPTFRNIVPSGNESGNRTIDASPVTIPNSNIPQQTESVSQFSRSTVSLMQLPDSDARTALGLDAKTNLVRDIGAALNSKTIYEDGVISDKNTSEQAMEEIANILVGEVSYQLGTTSDNGTGLGWYSANYPNAVKSLARIYPELGDDQGARNVFTAIVAITSNGEKVSTNISNALKIYDRFRSGETLQAIGTRRGSMGNVLDRLQELIDQYGMDNFNEHLLEELTVAEINASLRAAGKKGESSYTAQTIMPRAALYFGPKLGAFYANLMGSEGYLTMDLWWSRTFNRIRGTLVPEPTKSSVDAVRQLLGLPESVDDEVVAMSAVPFQQSYKDKGYKNGTELEVKSNTLVKTALLELNEAPFRASDRSFMISTTRMVQDKLSSSGVKLTLADIQAALWYYEKRLYAKLSGRKSDDIGYEEAITSIAQGDRPQRPAARFNRGASSGDVGRTSGAQTDGNVSTEDATTESSSTERERPSLEAAGQFSRRDVELAANGDPRAPQIFGISQTPAVLTAVGAPRQLLVMDPKNVAKVVNPSLVGKNTEEAVRKNASGQWVTVQPRIPLTVDELRQVPAMIADPVAVFNSAGDRASRRQGYKVLLDLVKDGFPVVAIIHPDVRFGPDNASELVSVYPANEQTTLNELNSDLKKKGQLLYFNKGKALALNGQIGNRLSSVLKADGSAKVPGQVPNRTFTPIPSSNFARALGQGGIGNRFTLPERTFAEKTSNLLANEMSRVTAVQNAVVEQGGTVTDKTRIEDVVHRMYGKAGNRMDAFRKTFVQPLIERAAIANVNLDDVAMYLYANHALERNDYIRSINPAFPDGGSGMSDADAKQIIKDMRGKGADFAKLKNVADQLQSVGVMTQQVLKEGGLVDQAQLDEWNQRYTNYVPLKGFEQIDENGQTGNGRFDPRNPFFKRAMGRGRRAGQIVENILLDHEEAIVAAEKNKVRQAFLKFALDNKDDALWHVNPVASQARFDKNTSLVTYATVMDEGKDTIGVRYNGKPYSIKVTDAAMLDDLVMGAMLPTQPLVRWVFNKWATVNRTLAKLWTALSPAFVLTNAERDLEFAIAKSAVEAGSKQTVDVVKDFIPAAYAIMRAERNNSWGANSELKKYYDMYKADGGKTGFMDLKTLDERQKEVVSAFKNAQASGTNPFTYHRLALRYVQSAEDFIMDINGGIENAARVAAYKSAIESGRTRTEAATIAKNLTVNFNRRGKLSPFLSSFYLFLNPAVQGAVATKNLMFSKKGAALGASLAAVGYMVASMAAGALGDDGEPYWEKDANRQAKLKSLLFFGPNGEQYTVPLAYGLGFFVNLGYAMRDLQDGASPLKVAKFMRDSFFVHFSPLGSMDSFANFLLPTLFDPIVVLRDGEREDGSPLLPPNIDGTKPASERYWTNTRDTAIERFTTWVNEATGGSKSVPGGISVSPEQVKYVTTFATGGAGTFIRDFATSVDLMMNVGPDAPIEKNTIPILKQFYKTNTGQMDQTAFYDNTLPVKQAYNERKDADTADSAPTSGTLERLKSGKLDAYADLEGMHKGAIKQLSEIRKRELEVIDNPSMDKAQKYQVRKALDEERRQVEVEFNREFYAVRKSVGPFTPWTK